jgi:hypothetical protein
MKIAFVFNFIAALLWFLSINAQIEDRSTQIPFEKVYLHMDRLYYSAGEDVWIKAYLVDAMSNKLSANSTNLNIELISSGSKIINRLVLRIDNGVGNADIHLGDSLSSGRYFIRAYTNWMRNFGDDFFFKKEIVIENQNESESLNQFVREESNEKVDVQFFPEGGPLIENVSTLLGFKAISSAGYGCNVTGWVLSSLGDTITSFASTHLGMGSFFFIPKKGMKYFASGFTGNKTPFRVDLPIASETGYSIKLSDINKDYFRVTIKTNQETLYKYPLNEMVIIGTSHNSLCVSARTKVKAIDNPVILPKKEFPEGVAMVTLMDTIGKTFCERVYYIHSKENYRLSIIPDQEVYAPQQKVTLQISVKDSSGIPVSANLSVSVVDGNQIQGFEKRPDIISYLLLESELRGNIEQPFYYFDPTIPGRFQALDNLLLTQGWRNFVWNNLPDKPIRYNYLPEEGITISGRLRHILADNPIAGANISLALLGNDKPSYKFTRTDSAGKYYFDGLNFSGPQNILVYAADNKDRGKGRILIDSLFREPAPVNFNEANISAGKIRNVLNSYDVSNFIQVYNSNEISKYSTEAERKYNILKQYHITDTIGLNEVEITARKQLSENSDGHVRLYGVPDFSLKITEPMSNYRDPIQTLQGRVPGLYITGEWKSGYTFIFHGQRGQPLFLLDDKIIDYSTIVSLPMTTIDKIEVIKDGGKLALYGFRGSFGVVSIMTKRGINGPAQPVLNFINQSVFGYFKARIFYAPKYDVKKAEYEKPDLRTTIYWESNVVTDEEGNATVSFFNADSKTRIKVDVEGIAEPGIPLTGKTSFEVK